MKNYINYYYGLFVDKLTFFNGKYIFVSGDNIYIFKSLNDLNLDYYNDLIQKLSCFKCFFTIVFNKENSLITFINNKPYILLGKRNDLAENEKIQLSDIRLDMFIKCDSSLIRICRFPWIKFWENKIDYLENWIVNKKDLYKNVYPIFNFFVGISENALLYLKETIMSDKQEYIDELTIQHSRIDNDTCFYDYYDPTNVVIDHSSRDVCEYFKSLWLNGIFDYDLFENYLDKIRVSKFWIRVMYSRLLFPSFFFDYVEESIIKNDNKNLSFLETKIQDFQSFLSRVSILLSQKYEIEVLKWL